MPDDARASAERRLRVLLVEDDDANRELESVLLRGLGHDVDAVADGAAALTALAAGGYDAVLMECDMPAMDGFATAAAIRSAEAGDAHVPIIGLTGKDERERCVEAGMDDLLAKPFALDALSDALRRATPPPAAAFAGVLDPVIVEQLRCSRARAARSCSTKLQAAFARDTPARLAALAERDRERRPPRRSPSTCTRSRAARPISVRVQMVAVCVAIERTRIREHARTSGSTSCCASSSEAAADGAGRRSPASPRQAEPVRQAARRTASSVAAARLIARRSRRPGCP